MSVLRRAAAAAIVARTNLPPFERPDRLPRALLAMRPWGLTLGGAVAAAAARYPDRVAIHDESGTFTYRDLWERSRRLAHTLAARGVGPDSCVGLLGRNHAGFVEWLIAASITGADIVLLNTGFAAPQLVDVVEHEGIDLILHDDEFADLVVDAGVRTIDERTARSAAASAPPLDPRRQQGRLIILTSGTTGRPKGAARGSDSAAVDGLASVYERVPFRHGDTQVVAAPLFHGWGLTNLILGIGRCTTNVLSRRFDPAATLRATSEYAADVLVVVPVMLNRILALPPDELVADATPSLRIIASSGSALGSHLAAATLARFGPVLYNLYGSTEVAVATIATPDDLLDEPATAGKIAFGVRVEILDDRGQPVPPGEVGRIFVGGSMRFEGYTGGGGKESHRGLLSSGDLGRFDSNGRLFVEGREDDMIVSGGENVFPSEVEELLEHHPAISEVAVVGVPDDEFGQALAAFVVRRPDAQLTVDDVRGHVRGQLARHKVPRRVEFVDELPRNPTGKILRRRLVEGSPTETGS